MSFMYPPEETPIESANAIPLNIITVVIAAMTTRFRQARERSIVILECGSAATALIVPSQSSKFIHVTNLKHKRSIHSECESKLRKESSPIQIIANTGVRGMRNIFDVAEKPKDLEFVLA